MDTAPLANRDALLAQLQNGQPADYLFFWGHQEGDRLTKGCLSQWYPSPFSAEGLAFTSAEHYMMYHKAMLFSDKKAAERALAALTPAEVKAVGRTVLGFNELTWREHRFAIVVKGNLAKFAAHPELKTFLLNTGDKVLVEASPVDKIWGIGLAQDHPDAADPARWRGDNLLGFALMAVRAQLAKEGA
ncbi:NADAR family protein [Gallaecimonas xiamenensis]|uniref:N-glycosidase YbiA n=1 Tax=Gallaecimonas xiamenensis 3-C-1 TaxID=745411 RepID=K2JTH7_9GAMM|nr:NADAR family protein [Gallaecimonas xiamenensis]EKE77832.1 hypothetical protein B3C1_00190 [Gallaecimonas xiamenensis 3-C-1]